MVVKKILNVITPLFLFFLLSNKIFSQTPEPNYSKHKIGFAIGYGDQQLKIIGLGVDLKVDYTYEIFFAHFNYIYSFYNDKLLEVGSILQAEFGITYYMPNKSFMANIRSHEVGMSGGVIFEYKFISEIMGLYFLFSVGPHYSKKSPERQVSGFMFNSNYNIGLNIHMKDNLLFDLRTGLRHLSNANLKNPNGGINNWLISFGLIYQLEK